MVQELTARVADDTRNAGMRVLSQTSPIRRYDGWAMGYVHALSLENSTEALALGVVTALEVMDEVQSTRHLFHLCRHNGEIVGLRAVTNPPAMPTLGHRSCEWRVE